MAISDSGDLRARAQDYKREKDLKGRWANGVRPKPGCVHYTHGQIRPVKTHKKDYEKKDFEFGKLDKYLSGKREIRDCMPEILDLLEDMSAPRTVWPPENDSTFSPSFFPPVHLRDFVIETGRETEQYVQNEFVILDDQGETASGKQGILVLRKAEKAGLVTEGFELV